MINKNKSKKGAIPMIVVVLLAFTTVIFGGGWAYSEGYLTGLLPSDNSQLEAKKSNYPNYIERFNFDGINFVDNVALAVPTPETVKTYAHLDGVLTLKHNDTKAKVLYVDTPTRVSLTSDDKSFYYSSEDLIDSNNVSFTRHKFYLLPNVEYNFEYKILNVNEFIDHSGEVDFILRDSDLTKSKVVTTKFLSPLSNWEDLKVGTYFKNSVDKYFIDNLTGEIVIDINERVSSGNPILYIEGMLKIIDYGTNFRIYYFPTFTSGADLYKCISNSANQVEFRIKGNQLYLNDELIIDNLVNSLTSTRVVKAGGIQADRTHQYTNYLIGGGVYTKNKLLYSHYSYYCGYMGFDTYGGQYSKDGSSVSSTWYYPSGNKWATNSNSNYNLQTLTCKDTAKTVSEDFELKADGMNNLPYLIDSTRTIKLQNGSITEVKLDLGDSVKTLQLNTVGNVTSFVIPTEYELPELEQVNLIFTENGKEKYIPVYYDPTKSQKDLWAIFETKLAELEG